MKYTLYYTHIERQIEDLRNASVEGVSFMSFDEIHEFENDLKTCLEYIKSDLSDIQDAKGKSYSEREKKALDQDIKYLKKMNKMVYNYIIVLRPLNAQARNKFLEINGLLSEKKPRRVKAQTRSVPTKSTFLFQ